MLMTLSAMTPRPTQRSIPINPLVAATAETMSPLGNADASFTSGTPLLAVAEPSLFLFTFALGTFGRAIGNADALDTLCLRSRLVVGRIECGIRSDQTRRASQQGLMSVDGSALVGDDVRRRSSRRLQKGEYPGMHPTAAIV